MMQASRTISIVVVDDDQDDADMLAALLEDYGHRVRVAGGARAATMRARVDAFRIVAVTGHGGTSERERAERSRIDSYLKRPCLTAQLHAPLGVGSRASE